MYEIQKDQSVPVKFFAGEYPVVTAVKAVATGKSVKQYEPVKLTDNGIEPVVKVAASEAVSGTSTPAKSEYENTTAGTIRATGREKRFGNMDFTSYLCLCNSNGVLAFSGQDSYFLRFIRFLEFPASGGRFRRVIGLWHKRLFI